MNIENEIAVLGPTFKYKEIPDKTLFEIESNMKISFQEKFNTPEFKNEEDAKNFLENAFFNSSCNVITEIKLVKNKDLYSFESLFSVYYIDKYAKNKKDQLDLNFLYEKTLENIKTNLNSEVTYINNHSFFNKHLKSFLIIILVIFIINTSLSGIT